MTATTIQALRRRILRWYATNGRTLPWRGERDPYRILVSEIMLQQTQVSRVSQKYATFLQRFPTLPDLARARQADVVRAWQGMGYNNRAVRLHALARTIVKEHNGSIPSDEAALLQLPGIGRYTARAILSSAFAHPVPVVDVNVHRVLSRLSLPMRSVAAVRPAVDVERLAVRILPRRRAYDWNQAIMDLGATICTARSPRCPSCPALPLCPSQSRMALTTPPRRNRERTFYGIPIRIHRGRIVEALRALGRGEFLQIEALGMKVLPAFAPRHRTWLRSVLAELERDGLVHVVESAHPHRSRVRLA